MTARLPALLSVSLSLQLDAGRMGLDARPCAGNAVVLILGVLIKAS